MKKNGFTFFLLHVMAICMAQSPVRLLVRGDDMGFSHSGNMALIKSYQQGIEQSIEVIIPSPWFPEAVKLLRANPGVDIGIHLALTSEWENVKWRPLTVCPSITDSNGYFFPMVFPNKDYPGKSISEHDWKLDEIEKEFRAQIELGLKQLPSISHLSAHMGCTHLGSQVTELAQKLANEYHIALEPSNGTVLRAGFAGKHETSAQKITAFIAMLDTLQRGRTYLFVEHPGINNEELKAIFHIGYENVATDRQGVTDTYTSEKVKTAIRRRGIKLISYADL
jgi:predicted glycoside hydrolase/deacetylase ChbG (UPF0249 family)